MPKKEKPAEQLAQITRAVHKKIASSIKEPRFNGPISLDDSFFDLKKGYSLTLTDGKDINEFNVAKTLGYVMPRMPEEMFTGQDNINIVLTNDQAIFNGSNDLDLKRSKSRKRWHVVKNDEEKKSTTIYIQIRDEQLGETDMTELMSNLAILHLLKKSDYSQIWQHVAGNKFFSSKEFNTIRNRELFENWKKKKITVKRDFDPSRKSALDILVEGLANKLPDTEKKPFLMIGNDFSWRLMMFTLFLKENSVAKLESIFAKELEETNARLKERNVPNELRGFMKKYVLLTLLNKDYHKNESTRKLYEEIFTQKNYEYLGFERLFFGERGPIDDNKEFERSSIAEPIDYWDPNKFYRPLLADESQYVQNLFSKLIDQGQPILSIPYMIGKMSTDLVAKLIDRGLIDREKIGFIGKVGNIVRRGKNHLKRGQIVIPDVIHQSLGDRYSYEYPNLFRLEDDDKVFIDQFSVAHFMTVPAVTLQNYHDFEMIGDTPNLCVEMEQHPLVEMLQGTGTRIISSFYVSDQSIEPGDTKTVEQVNISTPLDTVEGAIAVCFTTLFELKQLAKN